VTIIIYGQFVPQVFLHNSATAGTFVYISRVPVRARTGPVNRRRIFVVRRRHRSFRGHGEVRGTDRFLFSGENAAAGRVLFDKRKNLRRSLRVPTKTER